MTAPIYNEIGKTYDQTRQADPELVKKIIELLTPKPNGHYLDVACGSGNYTTALFESGIHISGIDISEEMLSKARAKNSTIPWILGDAKKLPFEAGEFDGATCILATHHIAEIHRAFQEIYRVLKSGWLVIFTSFPAQMEKYWLNHYFPTMLQASSALMHSDDQLFESLDQAGFKEIKKEKFFISNCLRDLFLQAGKYRPHLYLDPTIRSGISSFALAKNQNEIIEGSERLRRDIASGKIESVIQSYESDRGDYVFVCAQKKA